MQAQDTVALCQCGCGEPAPIATHTVTRLGIKKGLPVSYRPGHNNWQSSEELAERVGLRFGRWVLTAVQRDPRNRICYWCRCDCGNEKRVPWVSLNHGKSQSCGCLRTDNIRKVASGEKAWRIRHGKSGHPLYQTWHGMIARCFNPNSPNYPNYGGRGITVCDEWRTDPQRFFDDMGPRPEGMSLDRIDFNGNYEPSNCRWATPVEQANNRRLPRIEPGEPRVKRRETSFHEVLAFLRNAGWPDANESDDELAKRYALEPLSDLKRARQARRRARRLGD